MENPQSREALIVSETSFWSENPGKIVQSNVSVLNALFAEHLTVAELSADALRSYYVDYFLARVNNGGFSQFRLQLTLESADHHSCARGTARDASEAASSSI